MLYLTNNRRIEKSQKPTCFLILAQDSCLTRFVKDLKSIKMLNTFTLIMLFSKGVDS